MERHENSPRQYLTGGLLFLLLLAGPLEGRGQVLVDDFNRPDNPVVGNGWIEGGGLRGEIWNDRLRFVNDVVIQREWVRKDMSGQYNIPFSISSCQMEWSFNMRQLRPNPSGFNTGNYGIAFILGGNNANFNTGQGYVVMHGQAGTPDPIRIARYDAGLATNISLVPFVTATVAPFTDPGNRFLAIRVVYTPATDVWELHAQELTAAEFNTFDPSTVNNLVGSGVDGTYTDLDLRHVGAYWCHSSGAGEVAFFDNIHVPVSCPTIPPTANFGSSGAVVLEDVGVVNVPLQINPPAASNGTITVDITNGPGAAYVTDYTTSPNGAGGTLSIPILAGATSVNIPVTVVDDAVPEDTETVTFTITGLPGDMNIGLQTSYTLTIGDNDQPPTLLEPGDVVVVGVNANDGACSGGIGGPDVVSLFCFKDITAGTSLDLSDQGYSRCTPGLWGDNEGLIRITRTGPTIPAGTVITLRFTGTGPVIGEVPDDLWSWTSLSTNPFLNLNSNGDQLFVMQGGTWNDPALAHNATYNGGNIIYGFTTNGQWLAGQCASNLQSGLPPQMECFSTSAASSSDWTKYTGPISATNQRTWIIRIGDPANWSTYANCGDFNNNGPDYNSSYVFPITTTGFTPGLWTGGVSIDWFDCRNWDDARIPVATDDIRIDQTAFRPCWVGVNGPASATCASLELTSSGASRNLQVVDNSSLTINGPFTISRSTVATPLVATIADNSTLSATSITIEGVTPGAFEAILRCEQTGTQLFVEDGLTIGMGGLLDLQGGGANGGLLELGGDFTNVNDELAFQDLNSTVAFVGNGDQVVGAGSGPEVFHRLVIDKPGGDVIAGSPLELRNTLDLLSGRLMNSATSILTLRNTAVANSASDASFVHGPVHRIGNTNFDFPIGKGNSYRPAGLTNISGPASSAFIGEYYDISARDAWGDAVEPSLFLVSDCEYWTIDRVTGTPTAIVVLSWDTPESCDVTNPDDLRVARWDGSLWEDKGNGGACCGPLTGTIPTALPQADFSPWTLASVSWDNPLPVELLSFHATPAGDAVRLDWSTATELDNDFFTVERSSDLEHFHGILQRPGAGNSLSTLFYDDLDREPLPGISYYRLRQTDFDGTSTLSPVVAVNMPLTGNGLQAWVVNDQLEVRHDLSSGSLLEVLDLNGRLLLRSRVGDDRRASFFIGQLAQGVYLLRAVDEAQPRTVRFVR